MGKPSAPPPPDYTPIAQASQLQTQLSNDQFNQGMDLANKQFGFQQDQYGWAKDYFNKNAALNDQVVGRQLKAADEQTGVQNRLLAMMDDQAAQQKEATSAQRAVQDESLANARKAQARYEGTYQPLEDQAVAEARGYDSPGHINELMGRASSDVGANFEQQRQAAAQNLESFGVDPSSTRYAAMDAGTRVAQAAAQAGAANNARLQGEDTARQLRANAINVGRGLPSDVNAGNNTSVNAGSAANNGSNGYAGLAGAFTGAGAGGVNANNAAINSGLATAGSGANTMGTGVQYGGLGSSMFGNSTGSLNAGNGAINAWGNTLNNGYNNQMSAFTANQNSSSGLGSVLGQGLGFAAMAGFEEGGAVDDGSAVPMGASPSGGAAVDDVPAQVNGGPQVRLNAGEFIVPRDVVSWEGEKSLQNLIKKAREAKAQSTAKPKPVPTQPEAFTRPQAVPA